MRCELRQRWNGLNVFGRGLFAEEFLQGVHGSPAIALIREVLSKAESPLRASEIKQKKRLLKDSLTLQNVEEILAGLVTQGIVTTTAETPPRYARLLASLASFISVS